MNNVDSSGWIEYIADAANADFFEQAILDSGNPFVPTICLDEVFKRVLQEFGEERTLDATGIMSRGTIVDLDRQITVHAAHISNELKLATADSVILATARGCDTTLWTQHEHFK